MNNRLLPILFVLFAFILSTSQAFAVVKKTDEPVKQEIVKKRKIRLFTTLRLIKKELKQEKREYKKNKKARKGDLLSDRMFTIGVILFLGGMLLAVIFSLISVTGIISGLAGLIGGIGLILAIIAIIRYLI